MNIPPLNQGFEISPGEAVKMWEEGIALADDPETDYAPCPFYEHMVPSTKVRRSSNGEWVVRPCHDVDIRYHGLSLEEIAANAIVELKRLQGFGVDVISRALTVANTPDNRKPRVFIVTPWLPNLRLCPEPDYRAIIDPNLDRYYQEPPNELVLSEKELRAFWQYSSDSTSEITDKPFLHDVDPIMDVATKS